MRKVKLGETRNRTWDDLAVKFYGAEILGWNIRWHAEQQYREGVQPHELYGKSLELPERIQDFRLYV